MGPPRWRWRAMTMPATRARRSMARPAVSSSWSSTAAPRACSGGRSPASTPPADRPAGAGGGAGAGRCGAGRHRLPAPDDQRRHRPGGAGVPALNPAAPTAKANALQRPAAPAPPSPTDRTQGLSSAEAQRRLSQYGPNAIADRPVPAWRQLALKFWAPVPWMLEAVIVLQVLLRRGLEALVIAALLAFNAAVAFAQEQRAKDALALLRKRLHVRARVLRDGRWQQI